MDSVSVTASADGVLRVILRGEIDYTNAAGVVDAVRSAVRTSDPSAVRVDMAAVTFLDSSGIAVLVKAMKAARAARADYRVEAPQPKVLEQLRMTGLVELFGVEADGARTVGRADDGEAGAA
jgi:anti-sigma B factor antagonist